ncbi:MAG: tRNA lysidine(34) synthetase TilS [Muribaculaceae bacterium]|nr:tRNA lysidine(34) synthetase TilS [Muribaculaceae bacterium]
MNGFEEKVNDFISREIAIGPRNGKVIVALSGGADSVALLAVMTALGYDCVAAHCNFHLRGEESDRDMKHAIDVARALGAKSETIHFNVPQRMALTGESMEMACRELRYEWFSELKEKYDAQAVATGHHLEDNVETMLLNLLRGTGIHGACGIMPQADRRISPLLEMSRKEIIQYLEERRLTYVTDSSNLSNDITRNRLRNGILSQLEQDFPGALTRISRSLGNLRDDSLLLDDVVKLWRKEYLDNNKLLTDKLIANEQHPEQILFHILKPRGFNRSQCDAMLLATSGSRFLSGDCELVINRGFAVIRQREPMEMKPMILESVHSPNPWFTVKEISQAEFNPERDSRVIYIDADKIPADAVWEIRKAVRGDRMKPFGMNGRSKLISDIFNDLKTDSVTKESTSLLTCNGLTIWLIGIRGSELFKVTPQSRRILKITTCG